MCLAVYQAGITDTDKALNNISPKNSVVGKHCNKLFLSDDGLLIY